MDNSVSIHSNTDAHSPSTFITILLKYRSASEGVFTLRCDADLDHIPHVDVSFDLSELAVVPR